MRGLQPTDSGSRGARLIRPDWSLMPRGVELYSCCIYIAAGAGNVNTDRFLLKTRSNAPIAKGNGIDSQRREVYEAKDMLTARSGGRPCVARRLSEESVVRSCAGGRFLPSASGFQLDLPVHRQKPEYDRDHH